MRVLNRLSKKSAVRIGILLMVITISTPALLYWCMMASFNNHKNIYFHWIISYQSILINILAGSTMAWLCWVVPAVSLLHTQRTGQPYPKGMRISYYLFIWFPMVIPIFIIMTKVGLGNGDDWIYILSALGFAGFNTIIFLRFRHRLNHPYEMDTCPECGYSLRGLKSQRCPECGHIISHESTAVEETAT